MITPGEINRPPVAPQPVAAGLTRAAIFLVITVRPGPAAGTAVRKLCAELAGLLRAVGFVGPTSACPASWRSGRTFGIACSEQPRPAELHPFQEIVAGPRRAVATPGDLMFHIRAERMDLCFELATQIMSR